MLSSLIKNTGSFLIELVMSKYNLINHKSGHMQDTGAGKGRYVTKLPVKWVLKYVLITGNKYLMKGKNLVVFILPSVFLPIKRKRKSTFTL